VSEESEFNITRVDRLRYRPTREADEFLNHLRTSLLPGDRATVARLAISRSLTEDGEPDMLDRSAEMANAIEGTHLFGDDGDLWACLLTEASGSRIDSAERFRHLVEAHWHRGALLLQDDYKAAGQREIDFAVHLAGLAGDLTAPDSPDGEGIAPSSAGALAIRIGETSIEQRTNAVTTVELNAPGRSPHIAVMGKTRSGKTRTGLAMAESIINLANIPMLLIDPKGEFVNDGRFVAKSEWGGNTIADRFAGIMPLDVPGQPVPLDFLAMHKGATEAEIAESAIAFRDSFQKCIRAKGDIAMDSLRQVVAGLLQQDKSGVSLERIRDGVQQANEDAGRRTNSIEAKLNELTSLRLFEPTFSPTAFFSQRWVIGLGGAPDEPKRLVMFLLLDALARYLKSLEDSRVDSRGYRSVRHLLIVDEAREILQYRHAALSTLIRKCAARGSIVMLLSQSPEDFDQEEDDFLSQMGTIAVFNSSAQSIRNLRAALGQKVKLEDFSDKALQRGVALVKLPERDPTKIIAWR
jgi:DNA sulfur modification protein DndE